MSSSFEVGELVWGKLKGWPWWPARVTSPNPRFNQDIPPEDYRWLDWYGEAKFSCMSIAPECMQPLHKFQECFSEKCFKGYPRYKFAVFEMLQVAAKRAGRTFPSVVVQDVQSNEGGIPKKKFKTAMTQEMVMCCHEMITWANANFAPEGPNAVLPKEEDKETCDLPKYDKMATPSTKHPDKQESEKVTEVTKGEKQRALRMEEVRKRKKRIQDLCLACGDEMVVIQHPLFEGGLCGQCSMHFFERQYLYDKDGLQTFCTICCDGKQVIHCSRTSCSRCVCTDCLDIIFGKGSAEMAMRKDGWQCPVCRQLRVQGLLVRRLEWKKRLEDVLNAIIFPVDPCFHTHSPSPAKDRRPIRVLSLYDGIATGKLALGELGIQVGCYLASEINKDALAVSTCLHSDCITQVGGVGNITETQLTKWGPFDLLIGGGSCDDAYSVNPNWKVRNNEMFFEYYRILTILKKTQKTYDQPFFWLFGNVLSIPPMDKNIISRLLQCNPLTVDNEDIPVAYSRYFWGNLPGMNRSGVTTELSSLQLPEYLESPSKKLKQSPKGKASKQGRKKQTVRGTAMLPVPEIVGVRPKQLGCIELERALGLPYGSTHVDNLNEHARKELLRHTWSVPMIGNLLAPLTDFYVCDV